MKDDEILVEGKYLFRFVDKILIAIFMVLSIFLLIIGKVNYEDGYYYLGIVSMIIAVACVVAYLLNSKIKLVVTNYKVSGRLGLWRQVDLPIDSISSVQKVFLGVGIATSSGIIRFSPITNKNDIYMNINNLLMDRQKKTTNELNDIEALKKYKELLDNGIITKEEFEVKKAQILK